MLEMISLRKYQHSRNVKRLSLLIYSSIFMLYLNSKKLNVLGIIQIFRFKRKSDLKLAIARAYKTTTVA